MTKWLVLLAAGICAIVTASAVGLPNGATPGAPDPNKMVTVAISTQFAETAIPVTVRSGDQFTVTLPSNPSTGYSWQMVKEPDGKVLKKVGSKYNEPHKQNPPIVGAGGTETWSFKSAGKGNTLCNQAASARASSRSSMPTKASTMFGSN